jgi:hypothetical protein
VDGFAFARASRVRDIADAHLIVMTTEPLASGAVDETRPVEIVPKPFDPEQPLLSVERRVRGHPPRPG